MVALTITEQQLFAHKVNNALEIMQHLPIGAMWKNTNLEYVNLNQQSLRQSGLKHKDDIIGHIDEDLPWAEYAKQYIESDQQALDGKVVTSINPCLTDRGRTLIMVLVNRSPVYYMNKVLGVTCTVQELPKNILRQMSNWNLISTEQSVQACKKSYVICQTIDEFKLSLRESETLFLLLRGYTYKQIGAVLDVSVRTVETFIEQIKRKMAVFKKSQIIELGYQKGLDRYLPQTLLEYEQAL